MPNMRSFRILGPALLCGALAVSCGKTTKVSGVVADAPESDLVVRLLDVNRYKTIDTVKTDASGAFRFSADVKKGQPEFIYIFHGDKRIASLLLQEGDKVKVTADTLGNYSVTGSDETEKLMSVERAEASFANTFAATTAKLEDLKPESSEAAEVSRDLMKQYIAYYRDRVKYVMNNPYSLTVIPVLYQKVSENMYVFNQHTDAIHFRNAVDSLMTVYPESKYVKALDEEATRRESLLALSTRVSNAPEVGYPDLEMPDVNGNQVKLSSLEGKVVLLYFWTASSAGQKMLNLETIKPVYDDFHSRGLDIYAVSLDTDKATWASVVKHQNLDWTNVCDGNGAASSSLGLYNIPQVPFIYIIKDGDLVTDAEVTDGASLRKYLNSVL